MLALVTDKLLRRQLGALQRTYLCAAKGTGLFTEQSHTTYSFPL